MVHILFYVEMHGGVAFCWFIYVMYIYIYYAHVDFSLLLQQAVPSEVMIS